MQAETGVQQPEERGKSFSSPSWCLPRADVGVSAQLSARCSLSAGFGALRAIPRPAPRKAPGTPDRLLGFILFPGHQREVPRGGRGWKSIPELVRAIDSLAEALVAPVLCRRVRRGCPQHRAAAGTAQPSDSRGINSGQKSKICYYPAGNNGLAGCIHHRSGPRGWGYVEIADYLFILGRWGMLVARGKEFRPLCSTWICPKVLGMP